MNGHQCEWIEGGVRCVHLAHDTLFDLELCVDHLKVALTIRETVMSEKESHDGKVADGSVPVRLRRFAKRP